jgi:uncharacterized phiE125 gp8 family phage protein
MALATLADVKAWLDINNTTNDALLTRLIDAASAFIESFLNRKIELDVYTELRSGNGKPYLTLRNYPIVSVSSIKINGDEAEIIQADDFSSKGIKFDGRQLIGQNIIFSCGNSNILINYIAGFSEVPFDVQQACIEMVSHRFKNMRGDRLGVSGKSLAGESISFSQKDMTSSTREYLSEYKNVVPV